MIVYELNEVPKSYLNSMLTFKFAFDQLSSKSTLFETLTADVGSLSPWTWPTMHK